MPQLDHKLLRSTVIPSVLEQEQMIQHCYIKTGYNDESVLLHKYIRQSSTSISLSSAECSTILYINFGSVQFFVWKGRNKF